MGSLQQFVFQLSQLVSRNNFEYCIVRGWVLFSAKRGVSFIIVAVLDVRQILDLVALMVDDGLL